MKTTSTTQVSGVDGTIDQAALTDDAEASGEDPDDHPALGIEIEKLDYDSDFTVFMHEKVPQAIRRQALRHLWATNPILANVDGLNDYDEDFTDAATVVEGLKAAYDEACARRKAAEEAEAAKAKGAPKPEADDEQDDADGEDEAAIAEASDTDDTADVAEVRCRRRRPGRWHGRSVNQGGSRVSGSRCFTAGAFLFLAPAGAQDTGKAPDAFLEAAARGQLSVLARHLDQGVDPDSRYAQGLTALISAVIFGQKDAVELLLARKATVGLARDDGFTALMVAARTDRAELVAMLLKAGADPNRRGAGGMTALLYAAQGESAASVAHMLEAGGDPNAVDETGNRTALILAAGSRQKSALDICHRIACRRRQAGSRCTRWLDTPDGGHRAGRSGAHEAACRFRRECQRGNPGRPYRADDRRRPGQCTGGRLASGPKSKGEWRQSVRRGSALAAAVKSRSLYAVRLVVEAGGDVNAPGPNGKTPLMLAAGSQGYEIADFLLKKGADPECGQRQRRHHCLDVGGKRRRAERWLSACLPPAHALV